MLTREMKIRLGDLLGQQQAIVLVAARFAQRLEQLGAQQFAERIRCIHRSIDHDMRHVDTLGGEFGVERLAQHASAAHRRGMEMLTAVATHGGG